MPVNWGARRSELMALRGIMDGSRAYGGPVQVLLGITNRCNLRCAHCYYHSPLIARPNTPVRRAGREKGGGETEPLEVFRRREAEEAYLRGTIESFLSMGTRRFVFTGGGEPFLHPRALELMALAAQGGAHCAVNTNGTLLGPSTVDALVEMGFGELRITTMAGTTEDWVRTHPGSRGSVFEHMKENLLYLAERKRREGLKHPRVSLVLVITAQNLDALPDFTDFAVEARAEEVIFRSFDDVGDGGFSGLLLGRGQALKAAGLLRECAGRLEKAGTRHNVPSLLRVLSKKLDTTDFYRIVPCYYGWLTARVSVEGGVYPCCRCYRPLGDAGSGDVRSIWYGEEYRRFRASALSLNRRSEPVENCSCHSCVHHGANLRVFRLLHPVAARRSRLDRLVGSTVDGEGEA